MSCSNKNIRDLIFDFLDGSLDDRTAPEVTRHLKECQDCRSLADEYRQTIDGARGFFAVSAREHAGNESLVTYIDDPQLLSQNKREEIELHLDLCPACRKKADMLQTVADSSARSEPSSISQRLWNWWEGLMVPLKVRPVMAFAAAAVIVLLMAPLSVVMWSHFTDRSSMTFVQTADVVWLHELRRSDQVKPVVPLRENRFVVGLSFMAFFDEENYQLRLQATSDEVLHQRRVFPQDFAPGGRLLIEVEVPGLAAGEYRLVVIANSPATGEEYVHTVFPFILSQD
ncbi:MAG: zf-HC2 domain-containing protein [bacterium]